MAKRLPPLPRISDIIRLYGLSAQQQLSQNFILDLNITDKITRIAKINSRHCVCEVGPGPGALTRSILNAGPKNVIVVEKDRRFLPLLEQLSDVTNGRLVVNHGDILEFDWRSCDNHVQPMKWEEDPPNFHIIGNLPFSVSIILLFQWLSSITKRDGPFHYGRTQMTLTFQKEVAERITASPSHTQRSRLSIMVQHLCHIKWGHLLPSTVFTPKPKRGCPLLGGSKCIRTIGKPIIWDLEKRPRFIILCPEGPQSEVDAVVLKLTPLIKPVIDVNIITLEKIVKCLFQYRRKYIRKGARLLFPDNHELSHELFVMSNVDDTLRPQQLTLEDFEKLCQSYETIVQRGI